MALIYICIYCERPIVVGSGQGQSKETFRVVALFLQPPSPLYNLSYIVITILVQIQGQVLKENSIEKISPSYRFQLDHFLQ